MATQEYRIASESVAMAQLAARAAVQAAESNYQVAELAVAQTEAAFRDQLEAQLIAQEIKVAEEALKRSVLLAPQYSEQAVANMFRASQGDPAHAPVESPPPDTAGRPRYTVLKIFSRDGEIITQAPIMQLADLSKMVCVAEVYEADRKELYREQPVIIRSPAFAGCFADGPPTEPSQRRSGGIWGRVARIGRLVAPPGLTQRNPLAPTDRRIVEVLIEIDPAANQAARERAPAAAAPQDSWDASANEQAANNVGLQVTVEFLRPSDAKRPAVPHASTSPAVP